MEATFPVLPAHLLAGAACDDLPAHPLCIRPLPPSCHHYESVGEASTRSPEETQDDESDSEADEDEDEPDCRTWGLGSFADLDDATVCLVLLQLPKGDLLTMSLVSRAFHAFAEEDQLWKGFILHGGTYPRKTLFGWKPSCDLTSESIH